jgi:predicted MFS family arabinose efflux permease
MAGSLVFTAGPLRILAATTTQQRHAASGIFFATNFLAWFVAVTIYGQVIPRWGFGPTPFLAMAFTTVGLVIALALPQRRAPSEPITLRDFLAPLRHGLARTVMFFMALSAVAFGLMFSSLTQFLTGQFGAGLTAIALSSFYLARLPGSLAAAYLIQRWGQRRLLAIVFGGAGLALLFAATSPDSFAVSLGAILILGFQQATVPVAAMALAGEQATQGTRSASYGLQFAAAELGVAFALVLAGLAEDVQGNFRGVFLIFGALYLLGSLAAARFRVK